MADSILTSTKSALGLSEAHTAFDAEIMLHVNSVLSRLTQLGVGPVEGYRIEDATDNWEDFLGLTPLLNNAKSYMFLRVKLLFDPPDIGFVITAMKDQIKEEEWRIMVEVDPPIPSAAVVLSEEVVLDGGVP